MRLTKRYMLTVILVALLQSIGIAFISEKTVLSPHAVRRVEDALATVAAIEANRVTTVLDRYNTAAKNLAESPDLRDHLARLLQPEGAHNKTSSDSALIAHIGSYGFRHFALLTPERQVIISTGTMPRDMSDRENWPSVSGSTTSSIRSLQSNTPRIGEHGEVHFAKKIISNGKILGLLSLETPSLSFPGSGSSLPRLGKSTQLFFTRREGNQALALFPANPNATQNPTKIPTPKGKEVPRAENPENKPSASLLPTTGTEIFPPLPAPLSVSLAASASEKSPVLMAWHPVASANGLVVATIDRTEALAPVTGQSMTLLCTALALFLLAASADWAAGLPVFRQLAVLVDAATEFQNGNFRSRVHLRSKNKNELTDLASAFDDLASALSSTWTSLHHSATHDTLTGLPNRPLFTDRLDQAILKFRRESIHASEILIGVMVLDFDDFKRVNDLFGHHMGDRLLEEAAQRMTRSIRIEDTLARFGGDEFVALVKAHSSAEIAEIAHRLLRVISEPIQIEGHDFHLTASLGATVTGSDDLNGEELLRRADAAVYEAKRLGKNRVCYFGEELQSQIEQTFAGEQNIRRAFAAGELVVWFQPEIDLVTQTTIGVEALVRWQHPEQGILNAGKFIHAIQHSELIADLDAWVLRKACKWVTAYNRQNPADGPLMVRVNISNRSIHRTSLAKDIAQLIESLKMDPDHLCLEISENAIIDLHSDARHRLDTIHNMGIHLAIDDFGTGNSSITYLQNLPIDTLKVDKSFIDGLGKAEKSTALVAAITQLGQAMDKNIVAEGVESETQVRELLHLGCPRAQGHRFSPAMSPDALKVYLLADKPARKLGHDFSQEKPPPENAADVERRTT